MSTAWRNDSFPLQRALSGSCAPNPWPTSVVAAVAKPAPGRNEMLSIVSTVLCAAKAIVQEEAAKIYRLRLRVGKLGRAVATFASALEVSREHLEQLVIDSAKLGPYLRDLHDDVAATATLTADQNRALDGIVATHENNVATRQNIDMRRISALAALLAIPTVIAGIYGMNFKNIPLVQWQFGWLVIGATMVALDLFVFALFKRRKWL